MGVFWTNEALDDLAQILAYYYREAGPATAEAVERRIVTQLPYIVFLKLLPDGIVVLNVVHTARKFP